MPLYLQIETTNRCNLRCVQCFRREFDAEDRDLPIGLFRNLIGDAAPRSVLFCGTGEPFMSPDMFEMLRIAGTQGITTAANTHGILSRDRMRAIAESPLDSLRISMDAASEEAYARIRINGRYARLVENIDELLSTSRRRPVVQLNVVIQKNNIGELSDILDFARLHQIAFVYFMFGYSFGSARIWGELLGGVAYEDITRAVARARAHARRIRIPTNLRFISRNLPAYWRKMHDPSLPGMESRSCMKPWISSYITASGDVTPCCRLLDRSDVMGNIAESSFSAVWNGEKYRAFRSKIRRGEMQSPSCRECMPRRLRDYLASLLTYPSY
ncbi:MAG: radical SAM protein [bacterium]|nr:radical SAM protein [bacterium]